MLSGYFDIGHRRRERARMRAENGRIRLEQETNAQRRHQEMMATLAAVMIHNTGRADSDRYRDQTDIIRAQQQLIAHLHAELAALRRATTGANGGP